MAQVKITTLVHRTGAPGNEGLLDVYAVKVETEGTSWHELFGSREVYDAFVKGVKAGCATDNNFDVVVEETDGR